MSLEELRGRYLPQPGPRVLVHRGTFGDAAGAAGVADALRERAGELVVDAPCGPDHWAAPSATVIGDGQLFHLRRLDESGIEPVLTCLAGDAGIEPEPPLNGLLSRVGVTDGSLRDALAAGAYAAAVRVLATPPEAVIAAIEAQGLTGRGGAHFPTAMKWRFAAAHPQPLLIVNAEEGEPGVFKDRVMLEGDPHRLIEGLIIACHAVGAGHAYIYVNGHAHGARAALERALGEATEAGIIGGDALGATVELDIEVRSGAGGYVCGEETVILNSIEGRRPVPRFKPPQITDAGLFGRPSVLNNVETLAAATQLFDEPHVASKLVSLSGAVPRPGLYEVPVDGVTSWRNVLERAGADAAQVQALLLGGPSGVFVPPQHFDAPLEMRALGSGGVVALGADADVDHIVRDLAAYNARESCGECTPCREGTQRLVEMLDEPRLDRPRAEALIEVMAEASLCQLGGMAGRPLTSALEHLPHAFDAQALDAQPSASAGGPV